MKQSCTFAIITKDNEVVRVGNSVIYQPQTKPIVGGIRWYDDSKLLKTTIK